MEACSRRAFVRDPQLAASTQQAESAASPASWCTPLLDFRAVLVRPGVALGSPPALTASGCELSRGAVAAGRFADLEMLVNACMKHPANCEGVRAEAVDAVANPAADLSGLEATAAPLARQSGEQDWWIQVMPTVEKVQMVQMVVEPPVAASQMCWSVQQSLSSLGDRQSLRSGG